MTPSRSAPLAALLLAQLAVGSAAILARYGLQAGVSPAALTFWRLLLASCIVVPFALVHRGTDQRPLSSSERIRLIAAGVCLGLHFAFWFASLQTISVVRSTLLVSTVPLWTGVVEWLLLRRKPSSAFWGGVALATAGAYMLVTGGALQGGPVQISGLSLGDGLAVLGAVAIAGYLLLVVDLQATLGTRRVVAWTYPSAAVAVVPALIGAPGAILPAAAAGWWAIVGLAAIPQLLGHTLMNWSLRHFSAASVSAATLLEPLFASVLAWILLGEAIGQIQAVGVIALLAGVWFALRQITPPPEAAEAHV